MPKLQKGKSQWMITIPAEIVALKHWDKGQQIACIFNEKGDVVLREIR